MSAWWQFRALIRKNMLTLKRSVFMTLMEIFYPIILMILCYLIKLAFNSTKTTWEDEGSLKEYLIDKVNFGFDYTIYPYLMAYNTFVKNGNIQSVSDSVSFEASFSDFVNKFNYAYPDKEITEFYTKVAEINIKLLDKVNHKSKMFTYDEDTLKKKQSVLKTLPWISFSLNTFCQILSLVFIILLIKRIKHKSDYGIATDAMTQNGSALPNGSSSNRNAVYLENSDNQVYQEEKRKSKKSKKKVKKNERSARKEVFSNAESDQIEINKKSRKKKSRKKRSKSKDKKNK